MSEKRRNLPSQDQVSKYSWNGSFHSVLGWICRKQVSFGFMWKSVSWSNNLSMIDRSSHKTGAELRS